MGSTVPDAHLLALHAHERQVDEQGRDHHLAHLRPIAEALRPYGPDAEIAGALHDIIEDTRDHPDPAAATTSPGSVPSASPRSSSRPSTRSPGAPASPTSPA